MTPLSDALTTAQRRALAALEKAYVAGELEGESFAGALSAFGISDPIDVAFLLAALDVLSEWGVTEPTMGERVIGERKATEGQVRFIVDLLKRGQRGPLAEADLRALTFERASQLIDALKNERYKPEDWDVPF